ncbi:VapC toxin family PIN domain ribonuclease [Natronomonas sp. LN261]|uniref:VapC toxin family PIN domain ribonuclease n=1 Tax=Natronomonas sp. LN261 TaxID=2750669 RepID=UPI002103F19F|nr:VapC toxin family PIN domain ribonuclease [Natronomonas sp. LN261]
MKVLDATFLIDYLDGVEATKEFYEATGAENERWVMPVPAYAEALVGEGNLPNGDVAGARADLSWGAKYEVNERTAVTAGEITDEIEPSFVERDGTPRWAIEEERNSPALADI